MHSRTRTFIRRKNVGDILMQLLYLKLQDQSRVQIRVGPFHLTGFTAYKVVTPHHEGVVPLRNDDQEVHRWDAEPRNLRRFLSFKYSRAGRNSP